MISVSKTVLINALSLPARDYNSPLRPLPTRTAVRKFIKEAKADFEKRGQRSMRMEGPEALGSVVQGSIDKFWEYGVFVDFHRWTSRKKPPYDARNLNVKSKPNRLTHLAHGWGMDGAEDKSIDLYQYETDHQSMFDIGCSRYPHSVMTMKIPKRRFFRMNEYYNAPAGHDPDFRMILCSRKVEAGMLFTDSNFNERRILRYRKVI